MKPAIVIIFDNAKDAEEYFRRNSFPAKAICIKRGKADPYLTIDMKEKKNDRTRKKRSMGQLS